MPRDLQQSTRNEMRIQDAISGCEIILYYRQPTTPERIAFQRASWVREGKKVHNRTAEARAEYGELVLTGIREGDFSCGIDATGHPILIASEPGALNYRPDWKELVAATAGDLLMLLGMQVFEGSFQALLQAISEQSEQSDQSEQVDPPKPAAEGDEILPLGLNSNG